MNEPTAETPKKPEIRETISAKYQFTEKELADLGGECGRITATINNLKEEAKSAASEYKGRIDQRETQRNVISTKLANGYEMRPVEAIVEYFPERKTKVYLHPDTREIIREEEMTHADWQLPMFSTEELEKTKKTEEPPVRVFTEEEQAIITKAKDQESLDLDLDSLAENGGPSMLIEAFAEAADPHWPVRTLRGFLAIVRPIGEKEGTAAVIEFLRPFVVTK